MRSGIEQKVTAAIAANDFSKPVLQILSHKQVLGATYSSARRLVKPREKKPTFGYYSGIIELSGELAIIALMFPTVYSSPSRAETISGADFNSARGLIAR